MLRDLQEFLGRLYGIEPVADVREYLVTDPAILRRLEGTAGRVTDEKLLLREADDGLELTLFLAPDLLERLDRANPLEKLGRENLADFCLVLEGISHFNYLVWNAAADRRVTQLELELQAEIDKYVSARVLVNQTVGRRLSRDLFDLLFDEPRFDSKLTAAELNRYEQACRFATWYCRSLESRFASGLPNEPMLHELRQFFRFPQPDKVSHIHASAFA